MDVQETEDFELDEDDESFLLQHRALEESTLNYEELVNPSRNSITWHSLEILPMKNFDF